MKKPVVDYTKFRFSKINEPQYRHLWLLLGWVVYFALYFLTENLIPYSACHVVHSRVDDLIPFCEYFLVFYTAWYVLIFGLLLYYLLYDIDSFKKLQIFIMITQAIAMAVYIIWPSRQDMRPDEFVRSNFFTWLMGIIYGFDTSTGVCPSLHVGYSLGVLAVVLRKKSVKPVTKVAVVILVIMICVSTMFVKQHSFVDVIAAIPLGIIADFLVFGLPKLRNRAR